MNVARVGHRLTVAVLALALHLTCGGGGGTPAGPSAPAVPQPISPADGAVIDTKTPEFVVRNAAGFEDGATYDFVVLAAATDDVVAEMLGVPATPVQTSALLLQPLPAGFGYRWKAIAHAGGIDVESRLVRFEVGVPCEDTRDPWAKRVVDLSLTACTERRNRAGLLDPANVLGPPDARGTVEGNYQNFLSLGEGGVVTVDMGACIDDGEGADLRVFQYIESEPVQVRVAAEPHGPWFDLGTKACGDGGLEYRSNHCDFDLAAAGVRAARYVQVEDAERFPCESAGTRTEGADIDAVQVLNIR